MKGRKYKHVLITGGAGGIGKAMARCFLRDSYRVLLVDREHEVLQRIQQDWPSVAIAVLDVTDTQALSAFVQEWGPPTDGPDVIINCAGIHHATALTTAGYEVADQIADIEREVRTNFVAAAQHCALWRPHLMRRPNGGAIVNVASALAFVPKYSSATYCGTKAAIHQFSQVLALQLEGSGVRVVTVYPPLVATAMTAGRSAGAMLPDAFAERFYRAFIEGCSRIQIGESKWLHLASRISPSLASRLIERD